MSYARNVTCGRCIGQVGGGQPELGQQRRGKAEPRGPKGEAVLLSYPSANRDEDVFAGPFHFDAGRDPNKHLAFGSGVHYCLGAALARMETRAFYAELLPRLRTIELAGQPEWTATTFVGGLKHLPEV
ncbi:MAG TPA: cytochrome P450 [Streptosporangiaceae bacterium]|jgi:cytochrome P450|nr:cytochrome P450 [Streptosporangiaceae bacterium]